jgi:hypothetical protein
VTGPDPGRVLRLSLVAWGLGELALGHRRAGAAWLAAEVVALPAVALATAYLASGTAYLLPFAMGSAFIVAWGIQATVAYRHALAAADSTRRSPAGGGRSAAAVVWLGLPLLAWGTLFWLVAARTATPSAVLDAFLADWSEIAAAPSAAAELARDPVAVTEAADAAFDDLREHCAPPDSGTICPDDADLLRDVRVRLVSETGTDAEAAVEIVRYERRPASILGMPAGSELVAVPEQELLVLRLSAIPDPLPLGAAVGARRWWIVEAEHRS